MLLVVFDMSITETASSIDLTQPKQSETLKFEQFIKLKIVDHHDISTVNFEINLRHENRILSVVLKTKFRLIGITNFNCWRHMHRIL